MPLKSPKTKTTPITFKTIKDRAKPGSWRRGYGYYRKSGQVLSVELTDEGLLGKVKGNYKDAYEIRLNLQNAESISAQCDCPLEEEWCKHAVAVALKAIADHWIEKYLKISPWDDLIIAPSLKDTKALQGHYRIGIAWDILPKHLSFQLWDRRSSDAETPVNNLEKILKGALALQQAGNLELNSAEKRELKFIQTLYKTTATVDVSAGYFHVPIKDIEALLDQLGTLEEVIHAPSQTLIQFETEPLQLVLSINASFVGNVLIALNWVKNTPPEDVYPLEEIHVFRRDIQLGYYRGHMYPLSTQLKNLPGYLAQSSFYDIRDADGAKFLFEELPHIRKYVEVEQAEIIDKASIEQEPPKRTLTMRLVEETLTIRAELSFSYDETVMPYSKNAGGKGKDDLPYVTVTNEEKDSIYWLKRDRKAEEKAYQRLLKLHLQPLQTSHFMAEGDEAIDFYNFDKPPLEHDGWVFVEEDDMSKLKTSPDPLRIKGYLDFVEENVDQFSLAISCGIGAETMDLDTVQGFFVQGKKYIFIEDKGYVEIPLTEILQFTKTLNSFDKETLDKDVYLIKTYQAGLISELIDQGVDVDMSPQFQTFWHLVTAFNSLEEVAVPKQVNATLRPYQKQGFNWLWFLYSYGLNGILADDMGLGKTLQTLVLLQHAHNEDGQKPSLIICPTSVVYNWQKEAERFVPQLKVLNLTGSERHHQLNKMADCDIIITSYALLRRDINILKQFQFRYVILDESQNIKNYESQTAQASKLLSAQHRLALSGTPVENQLSELWSAFDFLMPGFLLDIDEFRYRYVNPIEEKGNRDAERRLKKQIAPFILRRLKRDVAKDLPEKVESVSYCEMLPEQENLYLEVLEKTREEVFAEYNAKGQVVSQASMLAALLRLRQVCNHPDLLKEFIAHEGIGSGKFEAMQELVEEIIENGGRILLFSQFVEMLKIVKDWLERAHIKHEYLTGETKDRQERVDRFNRDSSIPIFLISLKAGGTGLNLTGADYVIHYDPWWNPAVEEQATDRAHRIGQTKTVFVYRMITRGTVEEKIMKLKDKKRDLVDSIIAVDRDMTKKLTFEDLKDILTPDF